MIRTNGTIYQSLLCFNSAVVNMRLKYHRCRRSVDYFLIDRSIGHGRYRRSIRIHLLENTVDIDGR